MTFPPVASQPINLITPSVFSPPAVSTLASLNGHTLGDENRTADHTIPAQKNVETGDPLATLDAVQRAFSAFDVTFEVDAESERLVTKVVDRDSGELIRQLPSEELLRIAARLEAGQVSAGSLLNEWI